jgi:DNA-binding transcriptional ArsR family regulator
LNIQLSDIKYSTDQLNILKVSIIFNRMVEYDKDILDRTLHALADQTRRDILMQLGNGEKTVNEIAEPYDISLAAVSKHLKVLERAELILKEKTGRKYHCRMNPKPLIPVSLLINRYRAFWNDRLDELESFIDKNKSSTKT